MDVKVRYKPDNNGDKYKYRDKKAKLKRLSGGVLRFSLHDGTVVWLYPSKVVEKRKSVARKTKARKS